MGKQSKFLYVLVILILALMLWPTNNLFPFSSDDFFFFFNSIIHVTSDGKLCIGSFCSSDDASGFFVSLLFGLGPLFGGIILVVFALAFNFQHSFLTGVASGISFLLAAWRPLQLVSSSKMGFFTLVGLLTAGSALYHFTTSNILKLSHRKKASLNALAHAPDLPSALTLRSFFACGAIALHAMAEGLALGVAAPKAYGLGRHMVLPVSLHGLPRGFAVASCILGATDSWRAALAAATLTGFAGPVSAIGAILAGIDYSGLDYWLVLACGTLIPSFGNVFRRSLKLQMRKSLYGLLMGLVLATVCLTSTRLVCLHTPYCNSAPEAVKWVHHWLCGLAFHKLFTSLVHHEFKTIRYN